MTASTKWIAVVAASPSGVIGRDGDMPWQLGSDLRRFKRLTMGHPIVMGRKTYDSIGRPLPGRQNIVLSRSRAEIPGVDVIDSFQQMEDICQTAEKVYVIGGASIYEMLLPKCQAIYLTRVWTETSGDTQLEINLKGYHCELQARYPQTEKDSHPTEFQIWKKRELAVSS